MWVANEKPTINQLVPNCCVYMYHCNYIHRCRKQIESVEAILEENSLYVVFRKHAPLDSTIKLLCVYWCCFPAYYQPCFIPTIQCLITYSVHAVSNTEKSYQRNWTVGRSENEARIVPCHHLQDIA